MTDATIRVLLADDADDLRLLVGRLLARDGRFTVVAEAADGAAAVAAAEEHQPDLVVLDLSMPVMDGLEALPRIREVSPDSRVVVLSGFEAGAMAAAARELGAVAYVEKGASFRDLAETLATAVNHHG